MMNNIVYSSPSPSNSSSSSSPSSQSAAHKGWLAFSLSNNTFSTSSPSSPADHHRHPSHLSLFHAFASNPGEAVKARTFHGQEQDRTPGADVGGGAGVVLSVFSGCPKLEDFLGGGSDAARISNTTAMPQPSQVQVVQPLGGVGLSAELTPPPCASEIYESDLKTIAASFLGNYTNEQSSYGTSSHHRQQQQQQQPLIVSESSAPKKNVETFGQRTSIYRGVTRHRWTGRYEAHLWDNSCRREGQSRKGRQVYLGGYDKEEKAARAYDLAALKYWGPSTTTNFPISNYEMELEEMKNMTRQEFVASLRRKSSGFSRGASIYRGVTRHHQHGRWQARIGRVAGNKDLYLGTFSTQEEAAEAYDIAAIKFRGLNAVTNFDISRYDVKSIASCNLPIGGLAPGKSKTTTLSADKGSVDLFPSDGPSTTSSLTFNVATPDNSCTVFPTGIPIKQDSPEHYWSNVFGFQANQKKLQDPVGFSLGFNSTAVVHDGNNLGPFLENEGYNDNSTSNSVSAMPLATTVGNVVNSNEGYGGNGNWMNSVSHSYQTAKTNLSVLQTPIFGVE